jgi:hypothetical protein
LLQGLKITVCPNPGAAGFKVQVESPSGEILQYSVYNMGQRLVKEAKTTIVEQVIFGDKLPIWKSRYRR